MKIRVLKWILPQLGETVIELGGDVLSVGHQDGVPVMWSLEHEASEVRPRVFVSMWTGKPAEVKEGFYLAFVGTVQLNTGIVVHIFEQKEGF